MFEDNVRYRFYTAHISLLEGKLLTLLDASIADVVQRKALKDLLRQQIWGWAIENNLDKDHEENKVSQRLSGSDTP